MSNIRETVQTALTEAGHGQYMSYAEGVIAALEAREEQMAESLVAFAESQGLSNAQAWTALEEAGFTAPQPEPEPVVESNGEVDLTALARSIDTLARKVDDLATFAGRHGYSPLSRA